MTAPSDIIAIAVLAGLLSLLPVVILFWVYYLKERQPSVPARVVTQFFASGMLTVLPALVVERGAYTLSRSFFPDLARTFFAESHPIDRPTELLIAFLIAFGIVALTEEGFRYLILRILFRRTADIDQVVDGIQLGVAAGLGFAFIENALYFLRLFQGLEFNTLAIVFFLRFLISTFGHMAFGGFMGYALARALADPLGRPVWRLRAFWIPWVMHGLFDMFLNIQLSAYTVVFLTLPLATLWLLYRTPDFQHRFRLAGRYLRSPVRARPRSLLSWFKLPVEVLPLMPWCPTCLSPVTQAGDRQADPHRAREAPRCTECGTPFRQREAPSLFRAVRGMFP